MRICIIAEGSYPYITGGVSSWIHSIITQMPSTEFIIFAIAAQSSQQGQFKYELPPNVVEVKEIFLDAYLFEESDWGSRFRLSAAKKRDVRALLGGEEEIVWSNIFDLLRSNQFRQASDFLLSKDYFDILEELCQTKYNLVPFTEMFWTVRSMILPLLLTLRHEIPKADVYHSVSTGYAGVIGALAKHVHGSPFLLTEHGIYSREREEEIIKADWVKGYFKDLWIEYFYRLSGCAYEAADQVITLFNLNKKIQIELGCSPDKISVIPNGVNSDDYAALTPAPKDGKIRIGAIVRVVPIKDIKTMLQSFALIKKEVPQAELIIMGPLEEDPEYYEECLQMIEALEVRDVRFTGSVRVKDYLGQMDVLMLTSISEGQPLAILEGMACAKPFVATNVGSCRELLEGPDDGIGPAGFIAPVMHYEQIANAVIKLCKDEQLRESMGRNARERVKKYYKHEEVITGYHDLYQSLGRRA
ncbi:GT4 family glycosyltransferase PelF [Paenibacillus spongiae]|uniref:GT4 family glycosyltransferase PelF n=1 Tax=Paenibacillus spongiae TaxID=2909671 RepID=A0ABY5SG65_9BACL|nr:GT4 family glycosyltransferase PelF [Paenibacillus spongiae]UVI31258.1 GT4 family glycosyltransferase PelF [Paenibacillus spongiae]